MFPKFRHVLYFLLFFTSLSVYSQQKYYTFSELRGLEDNSGNTHLFYRLYNLEGNYPNDYSYSNSIYDLNLTDSSNNLFLSDGGTVSLYYQFASSINDYAFWGMNPSKYIYGGSIYGVESFAFLKRFDNANINLSGDFRDSGTQKIQISLQNDSTLYAALPGLYKSTDGGSNWVLLDSTFLYRLVGISPFNDQILFALNGNGYLSKSVNGGNTFTQVDTLSSHYYPDVNRILFDTDSVHLFEISLFYSEDESAFKYVFSVSSDKGNSWNKKLTSLRQIYISNDESKSGESYLAEGKNIYVSYDYGNTFSLFQIVDENIKGLYKQEGTDKVYVITKYNLYEVMKDSSKGILNTPIEPSILNFYPLHVGNKWFYSGLYRTYPSLSSPLKYVREVTNLKLLPNNKIYYEIKEYEKYGQLLPETYYERIDSAKGKVYRYNLDSANAGYEYLIDDLIAEQNDSVRSFRFEQNYLPAILSSTGDTTLFNNTVNYIKFDVPEFPTDYYYTLAKDFGLIYVRSENDNRIYNYSLNGAVINGQIYGDTTLTGVEKDNIVPNVFSLSQNYPNPFNPSTIINYEIPKSSLVTLKVYDILGREVATLVNEEKSVGRYNIIFNASKYSSGIYFYRITAGSYASIKKMVLLK